MTRFIFVTGGVISSLGKGLASASLGALLQERGYSVKIRKLDPYLNIDAGTMSPTQHGEVFVTDDGIEADLDLGHYERFTDVDTNRNDIITAGKIYQTLLSKERRGDYLGATVQVIPHVTDLIKEFIVNKTDDVDFIICEIGGTVGDIEGLPFLESIRQLSYDLGKEQVLFIHLTLVPYVETSNEIKTKPTQHSVKALCSIGIQPDILLCRSKRSIPTREKYKIAAFCNVAKESVIEALDVESIYQMPISYHKNGLDNRVIEIFNLPANKGQSKVKLSSKLNLKHWQNISDISINSNKQIIIAIVGKYVELKDAYKSIIEAFSHAGLANHLKVNLKWIDSHKLDQNSINKQLADIDGILVPGGFGINGTNGKILAISYARTNRIPILGICYGMQLMLIEFARNVVGLKDASSVEHTKKETYIDEPIVGLMDGWKKSDNKHHKTDKDNLGGTMRIGSYKCILQPGSKVFQIYGNKNHIFERHRHRYEANINYAEKFAEHGLFFTGLSDDGMLPEIAEIKDHPWFVGVQFHPEFKSRPHKPHPLFVELVKASKGCK